VEGDGVGREEGRKEGLVVAEIMGGVVEDTVGFFVGGVEVVKMGVNEGLGEKVGRGKGFLEGLDVEVGILDGIAVGRPVVGVLVGEIVGLTDGLAEGLLEGVDDTGTLEGIVVAFMVGKFDAGTAAADTSADIKGKVQKSNNNNAFIIYFDCCFFDCCGFTVFLPFFLHPAFFFSFKIKRCGRIRNIELGAQRWRRWL